MVVDGSIVRQKAAAGEAAGTVARVLRIAVRQWDCGSAGCRATVWSLLAEGSASAAEPA